MFTHDIRNPHFLSEVHRHCVFAPAEMDYYKFLDNQFETIHSVLTDYSNTQGIDVYDSANLDYYGTYDLNVEKDYMCVQAILNMENSIYCDFTTERIDDYFFPDREQYYEEEYDEVMMES